MQNYLYNKIYKEKGSMAEAPKEEGKDKKKCKEKKMKKDQLD